MLLAVTPLPNPDRTPPLTTTYFMHINGLLGRRASHINIPQRTRVSHRAMLSEESKGALAEQLGRASMVTIPKTMMAWTKTLDSVGGFTREQHPVPRQDETKYSSRPIQPLFVERTYTFGSGMSGVEKTFPWAPSPAMKRAVKSSLLAKACQHACCRRLCRH